MTLRRTLTIGGIVLAGLLVVLLLATSVLWVMQRGRVLPNTSIATIDVSGMTADDVREAISPTVRAREDDPVVFRFENAEYDVVPTDVGYSIDVDATVQRALERGRRGLPGDIAERVRSLRTTRDIPFEITLREGPAADWIDDLADELDRPEVFGDVDVDVDTLEVEATLPQGEVVVRRDDAHRALVAALRGDGPRELELPADTTEQPLPTGTVERVAEQVEEAIDGPLELSASGETLTLTPRDLAELVQVERIEGDDPGLELRVSEAAVEDVMGDVARGRFELDPVSASYTASRTPPRYFDAPSSTTYEPVPSDVGIEEGRDGARFDAAMAAEQLTELLRQGAREAALRLETVKADLSNARAAELRPTHAIGTFTTYHQAGQARVRNIQRLADVIDGALVLPGEQFSINEISGQRSCDKGYVPAGTIINGELVDTCGGGTSQFGTTTFNAAFFAGVQLDQWKAHSWYISRYPMGREATLSFPQLDVKFTNTTDGAILVKTTYSATSITVTLHGQPLATAVSASHGGRTNPRGFDTDHRTTSELREGQQRVIQSGQPGFTTEVVRRVRHSNGEADTRTIRTVYVPQTRIVEHGTAPPPASDDGDDDDDPEVVDEGNGAGDDADTGSGTT